MSETIKPITGEARRARIKDIRARKGHLLGRGFVANGNNPGYVSAIPEVDPMKYSVQVHINGEELYVYKGIPETSIRQVPANESEYGGTIPPSTELEDRAKPESTCRTGGRVAMNGAVERQQHLLAKLILSEREADETARIERLSRYVTLLGNPDKTDRATADEFNGLAREFYLPRTVAEECRIMNAGGVTYGI